MYKLTTVIFCLCVLLQILSPVWGYYGYGIGLNDTCNSFDYVRKCSKGTRGCFASYVSKCCGSCYPGESCRGCSSGSVCTGSSCTSLAIIVICLGIWQWYRRTQMTGHASSNAVVVVQRQPVYETTTVSHVAPPPQQHYVPDQYQSNLAPGAGYNYAEQPVYAQPVVAYPQNQYGAPQGVAVVTTNNHDAY